MTKQPGIKPSELVLMAVHNLEGSKGVSEKDIVKFISLKLKAKPEEVKTRVKAALARSLALQLVTHNKGRFKMFDVLKKNKPMRPLPAEEDHSAESKGQTLRKVHRRVMRRTTRKKMPEYRPGKRAETQDRPEEAASVEPKMKERCKCCGRRRKNYVPLRLQTVADKLPRREDVPRRMYKPSTRW